MVDWQDSWARSGAAEYNLSSQADSPLRFSEYVDLSTSCRSRNINERFDNIDIDSYLYECKP